MGYIKKLKNNELVGGTDKHTIYPVTSTKAVFEEVTEGDKSSFKSQEIINSEHDGRIKGLESEMPDTIKSITINGGTKTYLPEDGNVKLTIYSEGGEDYPGIAEAVQNNADNIEAIQNEIGTDTTEDTLSGRIKGLETTVGTGGSVDQRISDAVTIEKNRAESIEGGLQTKLSVGAGITLTSDGVISATADPSVGKVVEARPTTDIVDGMIYLVQTDTPGTYKQWVHSNGEWIDKGNISLAITTDDTLDSTSSNPIQNAAIAAQIGYFVCGNSYASSEIKDVDALGFKLPDVGGDFKIKMNAANTHAGPVYLRFNSSNATKAELKYNRESVSPNNTWEENEVISVYYDGTYYQASNAQGGGGKAEKIKYDNSQSGLATDNVQGALDELNESDNLYSDSGYNPLGKSRYNSYAEQQGYLNLTFGDHSISASIAIKRTADYTDGPVCTQLYNGRTYKIGFDYVSSAGFNPEMRIVDSEYGNRITIGTMSGSGHIEMTHTMTYDSGAFSIFIPANAAVGLTCNITNFYVTEVKAVKDVVVESVGDIHELENDISVLDKMRVVEGESPDLDITDESGFVLARFEGGQIETKNFKSSDVSNLKEEENVSDADLSVCDESGNVIVQFKDGHIATQNFDSRYAASGGFAKLRFAHWNIAHFNLGDYITNHIDTEEEYEEYLPVYRGIFNDVNADFISLCEFESPFYANHPAYTTKRELFPNYAYYKDNATSTSGGNWLALFSHLPLYNVTEVPFTDYPSGAYRYYLVGDMIISGKTVKVVCTHLSHDESGSGGSNAYAPLQIAQLISDFQDYQNVVMLADWNTAPEGFQPFKDAGYTMANNDFLGTLQTYWNTTVYGGAMDNIVVKGGSINNINVVNVNDRGAGTLSDHYLIYCDIVFE